MILYVTAIVVAVTLLSSGAFVVYINSILRRNALSSFSDLSDKLAQNIATLIGETELLGQSMARDTVLVAAMLRLEGQYTLARQYDDYFQIRSILSYNQDHKQLSQIRLVFRHAAFYTREGVSLLSAQSEGARTLDLGLERFASDPAEWQVWNDTIRYIQPVLNYKYASAAVGLVVLELSDERLERIFSNLQSLGDARYELLLHGTPVRVFGTGEARTDTALYRSIDLSHGWRFVLSASDVRHAVRLPQSLLTIGPWVVLGCLLVLVVFSLFAKRFYRGIASLARAISTVRVLGDEHIGAARYRELSVIVSHFNELLTQIRRRFAEEIQAREKERTLALRMLESQINPHFLYNSLDVINWLAFQQGAEDVASLARSLGMFYRDALSRTSNENSLADELAHVRTYLDIMRCRSDGELSLTTDVPDAFQSVGLPRLSLQPIVENAVQHGILRRPDQRGCIELRVWREEGRVYIGVRDNGPGMSQAALEAYTGKLAVWPPEEMHGLINIHQRTRLLYGKAYGVTLRSEEGQWMEVMLSVPCARLRANP